MPSESRKGCWSSLWKELDSLLRVSKTEGPLGAERGPAETDLRPVTTGNRIQPVVPPEPSGFFPDRQPKWEPSLWLWPSETPRQNPEPAWTLTYRPPKTTKFVTQNREWVHTLHTPPRLRHPLGSSASRAGLVFILLLTNFCSNIRNSDK